jgi:translocation and assembly module TamA
LNHLLPTDPGRTVLAARALAGLAQGAAELSLPPDQRFYAGGSGTIRGYAYQSVGPKFIDPDHTPIGGTAITAGSLELRQRWGTDWGAALFMDAGQVSASLKATPGEFRVGAGVGLRYYTPIGPIRLDVAVPIPRHGAMTVATGKQPPTITTPGDDAFEIYIGLGQAF